MHIMKLIAHFCTYVPTLISTIFANFTRRFFPPST